jgi:hypothetical protein
MPSGLPAAGYLRRASVLFKILSSFPDPSIGLCPNFPPADLCKVSCDIVMKPQLKVPKNFIDPEAEDHAEETRYAVTHHGRELHPDKSNRKRPAKAQKENEAPWQLD